MSSSASLPVPSDIASLTAPPLAGAVLNWALLGMLTVQIFLYSQNFPQDRTLFKSLVYFLFVMELAQSALITGDVLHWFAIQLGDRASLSKPWYSAIDAPVLGGIMAPIVQLFFCWRIYALHGWWPLSVFICLISLAGTACALATGIITQQSGSLFATLGKVAPYRITWLACSAIADTLIAVAMIYTLVRKPSGEQKPADILLRIVRMVIETNAMTAVVAITGLILTLVAPKSEMVMTPAYVLGKLYSNTLMVVFNDRVFLTDSLSLVTFDRALALSKSHLENRHIHRRFMARSARSSVLSGDDYPEQFKLEVFQQTEINVDAAPGVEETRQVHVDSHPAV